METVQHDSPTECYSWVLLYLGKSWSNGGQKINKTVQSLTFLTKQSELKSAENERQSLHVAQQRPPSADAGPLVLWQNQLFPWSFVLQARLSCHPESFKANKCSHLQLFFMPAIASVFRREGRQTIAEGLYFLGVRAAGIVKLGQKLNTSWQLYLTEEAKMLVPSGQRETAGFIKCYCLCPLKIKLCHFLLRL